ncbi:MAG: threonine dehydratase, partial [Rhodospirillaceae bacterium]
ITESEIHQALAIVRSRVPQTPAYAWPLLAKRLGHDVVVKHENHTPTGSFKARGGLVYVHRLLARDPDLRGIVTATRGNHGQSVALAGSAAGVPVKIVVPEGNSPEKNAAMEAFGGTIVVGGKDFDESRQEAAWIRDEEGYHFIPSFHRDLVAGVATYAWELFAAHPDLARVYVPIGMGSGICSLIAVRDLMGLKTDIIGVVAEGAPAFAQSFAAGHPTPSDRANTFADGMACRDPQPEPFAIIKAGAADVVTVSDAEIAEAVRTFYTDTHNLAEGAGAAALAALTKTLRDGSVRSGRSGVILTGGNIDQALMVKLLAGDMPT